MLYTIATVLIVLWLLGLVTSYTMGGFVHVLLVIAIVMVLVNVGVGVIEMVLVFVTVGVSVFVNEFVGVKVMIGGV